MLRAIREWFEIQAAIAGSLVVHFSAIYWVLIVLWKFLMREPLLYAYDPAQYTQETVPVAAMLLVHLIAIGYQFLTRSAIGEAWGSYLLLSISPKVAFISTGVLALWGTSTTAPKASVLPLAALSAVSVAGAVLVRWGPLTRDTQRLATVPSARQGASPLVARVSRPSHRFADLHGHRELKSRLLDAGMPVVQKRRRDRIDPPRNGILLHGKPGNGKTMFVEALAGEMRLPLLTLTYTEVASKWVGEKTEHVRTAFEQAVRMQPCLLFLDEVDSFLESREHAAAGSLKEDRDLVNALLTLIVQVRVHRVLLVAATNHLDRLDPAAVREGRFDFKIEVPPPDHEARLGLLQQGLGKILPRANIDASLLESLARRWKGYSAKRILAVVAELPAILRASRRQVPEFPDFMAALRAVQGRSHVRMENVRPLGELVLSERTRLGLDNILARMHDPERTESLSGTLPNGVVFHGPPGTGKTAAAKRLANELGWTFLVRTGSELARNAGALQELHAEAQELRPAIVFIDEADGLMGDRTFSLTRSATNELLAIMDGAIDRVPDVVWIAATNHLEQIEPALLRGGRFSEKVVFDMPSRADLVGYVTAWLRRHRVSLEPSFEVRALVGWLGEASIANADAVLQTAVNVAIARGDTQLHVTRGDVQQGIRTVMGE